jgi:acetyl esterase/lipase
LIAVYPPLDLKIPFFTVASERDMVGFPMYPPDTVENYVATLKGNEIVSTAMPPERLDLGFSAIQQGKYVELLGVDPSLFPIERLDNISQLPSIMILHGQDDSAIPFQSSEAFVEKVKKMHPNLKIHYNVVPGCEHGLDAKATLETTWLKEGLDFITPLWLGSR